MKRLQFDYWMEIRYSEPVTECHYTLKCLPKDTDMQKITELKVEISPWSRYQMGEDSFGNGIIYDNLYENQDHDRFGFHVSGVAFTGLNEGGKGSVEDAGIYKYPHGLNAAGDGIKTYFKKLMQPGLGRHNGKSRYNTALYLMYCLYRDFNYEKGITGVSTAVEEAWSLGGGVCQDYAHILIALCHLAEIPARYVTGMMIGEGFSHAWVEIWSNDRWYGLDPTNGCTVNDSYIKIGAGRDANDCLINKGIVKGGGMQTLSVCVRVEEILL